MKIRLIIISIIAISSFDGFSQTDSNERYYYYNGEKRIVEVNKNKLIVYFEEDLEFESNLSKNYGAIRNIRNIESINGKYMVAKEIAVNRTEDYEKELAYLKNEEKVKVVEIVLGDSITIPVSNHFYVKLNDLKDTTLLHTFANNTKTKILRPVLYSDNWYVLEVDKNSVADCIGVSNIFFESNSFEKIDPGFIFNFSHNCVTDNSYDQQWSIDNTGIDINACGAWSHTAGSEDIILAVIDMGIDNDHDEFVNTEFTISYDADNRVSPAGLYDDHGNHVCGIISSNHNQYEIAGVAPGLSVMEISHSLMVDNTISEDLAAGINWAVKNGADILNNSWGDQGGEYYGEFQSTLLEDAIDNAIDSGRNGLGCVVAFTAGNHSPAMNYPAIYRAEILTVGAINSTGLRRNTSGFGHFLDVVAPGGGILSTIRNNQYDTWNGTSMACPHVSGVAGLVLSVRPCLSHKDVVDIIELTAQKVGGYNYQVQDYQGYPKPNGTYHLEMGYGLVDAEAAVNLATTFIRTFEESVFDTDATIRSCDIELHDCDITNNADIQIEVNNTVSITGTFNATLGCTLEIN